MRIYIGSQKCMALETALSMLIRGFYRSLNIKNKLNFDIYLQRSFINESCRRQTHPIIHLHFNDKVETINKLPI